VVVRERPVLVAPDSFKGTFRATQVAGAVGRGLERAGLMPPDLCPVADGGEGTLEVVLTALGGETAAARVRRSPSSAACTARGSSCCATCACRGSARRSCSGRRKAPTRRRSTGSP